MRSKKPEDSARLDKKAALSAFQAFAKIDIQGRDLEAYAENYAGYNPEELAKLREAWAVIQDVVKVSTARMIAEDAIVREAQPARERTPEEIERTNEALERFHPAAHHFGPDGRIKGSDDGPRSN